MKQICFLILFLGYLTSYAQPNELLNKVRVAIHNSDAENRTYAYKTFIGNVLSTNNTSLAPSFVLDISEKSSLKLALPLYPLGGSFKGKYDAKKGEWAEDDEKLSNNWFFAFVDGKVGASDNFTSLYKKGKWQTKGEVGGAVTFLPLRRVKYYTAEVEENNINSYKPELKYIAPIEEMSISQASQIRFIWINLRGGFSYNKLSVIDTISVVDTSTVYTYDTIRDRNIKGAYGELGLNWYSHPSKYLTPRISFFSQATYRFEYNGTNYDELSKIEGTIVKSRTGNASSIDEEVEFKSVDGSKLVVNNKHTIRMQGIALINSLDHKFYFGIGGFFEWKKIGKDESTDMGITVNVPVKKKTEDDDKGTMFNLQLRFVWADIKNNNYPGEDGQTKEEYRKNNFNVGFTVAVPIIATHRYSKPKEEKKE